LCFKGGYLLSFWQPNTAATLSLSNNFLAFSGKTSVNFDSGSSTTASICLPMAHALHGVGTVVCESQYRHADA
jgi:hypothetical protein